MREAKSNGSGTPARGMRLKKKMLITTTISRKVVPQRVCAVEKRSTSAGVSGRLASWALIALCSAPWYAKTRLTSLISPISPM